MKNLKILQKDNLFWNLQQFSGKKICAMVKCNAYGHGLDEIVNLVCDKVDFFGVVSVDEGIRVRNLTDKRVLICSLVEDFQKCAANNLEVIVDNVDDVKKASEYGVKIHLKINCGMNRFGVASARHASEIDKVLRKEKICLQSVCTHFPNTENEQITMQNYCKFLDISQNISQKVPICFGGSGIADYPFNFDVLRLGIGLYGYGAEGLKPVLKVVSHICKVFRVSEGECVGYGSNFVADKNTKIGIVPLGYGDGLRRALSGNFDVEIAGKIFHSVGSICMDCFFVEVDESVKVGDEVVVMSDSQLFAQKCGTIPYEILTGFSSLRGKTLIL